MITGREEARRIYKYWFKRPILSLLGSRAAVLAIACVMIVGGTAGGTVAWLFGQSAPLRNTFAPSGIDVTADETPTEDGDEDPNTNTYTMLPGAAITKDPIVTVAAGSEDAWLFVKLEKSENFDHFLSYSIADGWTALDGEDGVYWRTTQKSDTAQTFGVIRNNEVTVKPDVTAAMLNTLSESTRPTLAVTAYAVQQQGVGTASQAWALAQGERANP